MANRTPENRPERPRSDASQRGIDPIRELALGALCSPTNKGKGESRPLDDLITGTRVVSLDDKNRLYIPTDFRKKLGDGLPVYACAPADNSSIFVFSRDEYTQLKDAALLRAQITPTARGLEVVTLLLNRTEYLVPDNAHRIALPSELMSLTGLQAGSKALVIGSGNFVEIKPVEAKRRSSASATRRA